MEAVTIGLEKDDTDTWDWWVVLADGRRVFAENPGYMTRELAVEAAFRELDAATHPAA